MWVIRWNLGVNFSLLKVGGNYPIWEAAMQVKTFNEKAALSLSQLWLVPKVGQWGQLNYNKRFKYNKE